MRAKLLNNIHVVICAGLIFATMFVFFTYISPSVPFDSDDWHYLSSFPRTPVPIPPFDVWNPTRVFPEHLMPAAGYFSAFVAYPLTGDYIFSITATTALLLAIFLSALYISLYRLFLSLNENKGACAMAALFAVALCFALFRSLPSGNLHLFIVYSLNLHYFYTLPNILNSIIVCELMRLYIRGDLSFRSTPRKAPLLVLLMYFCIFSILFSALTLLAFSVSILLCEFLRSMTQGKEKLPLRLKHFGVDSLKRFNIAIVAVVWILFAMVAESLGGRAKWDNGSTFRGSIFSIEFLSRMLEASRGLLGFARSMNKLVLALMILLLCAAACACVFFRKKGKAPAFAKAAPASFVSCAAAFLCVVLVSAKGGPQYARDIRSSYSVFFFGILTVSLAALYLWKRVSLARTLFPLMTVLVILVAVNTRWPYAYTYGRTHTQTTLIESYIEEAVEADLSHAPAVELRVPIYGAGGNWPIHVDSWGDEFSNTLYRHHITSGKIDVRLVLDGGLPAP